LHERRRAADFLLTGHRGDRARFPENTLSSILGAIECGATAVEVDIRATSDGVLVLSHDHDLTRVAGKPVDISSTPFDELRSIEFEGERIATLSEVARAVRGKVSLDLDIKVSGYEREILQAISREGDLRATLFTSFSLEVVSDLRGMSSEIRTGIIEAGALEEATDVALSLGVDVVLPEVSDVNKDSLTKPIEGGLSVVAWTVNDPEVARDLFALGVDGIVTDDPCMMAPHILPRTR